MKRILDNQELTVLIPIYNEEKNIPILLERLSFVLSKIVRYNVLFIDDGSSDRSIDAIKRSRERFDNIYFISLSRNFGHQNALKAGIDVCRGDIIVSLDGDLQHPPEVIPEMLKYWQEGYDIVYTCRKETNDNGLLKRFTSNQFYQMINLISGLDLKQGVADFRLIDKKVLTSLRKFNEYDLFYRGIIATIGFKQKEVPYIPSRRAHGVTKYSFAKMFNLAVSGITGFSIFPLRVLTLIGFIFSTASFSYGLYSLYIRFFTENAVPGWTSIMAGIYFLGGLQLAAIGICGEYIGKIFLQVKGRPTYIISESMLPEQVVVENSAAFAKQ